MHVKIQGGGDGVYANSGSCSAAAMYCEHERQQLMEKGLKPETFFHQYSDFVSTTEVIDKIDHNKKKLRKEDAKFFVLTVSPSADEQRKMGKSLEDRIASFKNYIRTGVMAEYAKNFGRGLSADDIMYYAYIHIDRGDKAGEQMHAHIIVSRRNMDNSISLSPQSNHRKGKGVIAHGFNRDRFSKSCERSFDNMMNYNRAVEESYEYRNALKNGTYEDISKAITKVMQNEYGVISANWDNLTSAKFQTIDVSETNVPVYETAPETEVTKNETTPSDIPVKKPAAPAAVETVSEAKPADIPIIEPFVTETKIPEHHQVSDTTTSASIIGFAKKAWYFAAGFFSIKEEQKVEQKEVVLFKEEVKDEIAVAEIQAVKEEKKGKKKEAGQTKLYKDGFYLFKPKNKDYYVANVIRNGQRVCFAENIEVIDVQRYYKARNSKDDELLKSVIKDISDKYFKKENQQKKEEKPQNNERVKVNIKLLADNILKWYCNKYACPPAAISNITIVRHNKWAFICKSNGNWQSAVNITQDLHDEISLLDNDTRKALVTELNKLVSLSISTTNGINSGQYYNNHEQSDDYVQDIDVNVGDVASLLTPGDVRVGDGMSPKKKKGR